MKNLLTSTFLIIGLISSTLQGKENLKTTQPKKTKMISFDVVHKPKMHIIGVSCRTSNASHAGPLDIPKLWEKFYAEDIINQIPNKVSEDVVALYCDYEGNHTQPYTLVIGCPVASVADIPDGMVAKEIPESTYALFHAKGSFPDSLIKTWQDIWQQDQLERTYKGDFELYKKHSLSEMPEEAEIYIGIENQQTALIQSVLQGRLDAFHLCSVESPLPEAYFKETNENYLYAWGMDYVCSNGVIEKNQNRSLSEKEMDDVIKFFESKNLPFMWWSADKNLETKGFQCGGALTGIAADLSQQLPPKPSASPQLEIKVVQTQAELEAFTNLATEAFAMSPQAGEQWTALNGAVMKKGKQRHFLAFLDGKAVGTATLSLSPKSAGIWNLATLPKYRKVGIGGSLVYAALLEAKKQGHDHVIAILMPKGLAWGLFTKMGFQAVCEFPFYIYGISADELES